LLFYQPQRIQEIIQPDNQPTDRPTNQPTNQPKQEKAKREKTEVRTVTVLFSELLVPGWAEGPDAKIGVTAFADSATKLPCHQADPETFFAESQAEISYAKALCGECPMRAKCLEGALSRAEPCGIWGGELFEDGKVIQAKRSAGRPRLNPLVEVAEKQAQLAS
jgi:WhiB family redox-sensing transcriptional regulator